MFIRKTDLYQVVLKGGTSDDWTRLPHITPSISRSLNTLCTFGKISIGGIVFTNPARYVKAIYDSYDEDVEIRLIGKIEDVTTLEVAVIERNIHTISM